LTHKKGRTEKQGRKPKRGREGLSLYRTREEERVDEESRGQMLPNWGEEGRMRKNYSPEKWMEKLLRGEPAEEGINPQKERKPRSQFAY